MSVSKAALVLLPGSMCDERLFGPQIKAFSGERSVHTIIPSGRSNMAELATLALQQAPAQFALAGLSLGGILAMEIVRQAPERVLGLALMDTNPRAELPEVQSNRQSQIDRVNNGELQTLLMDEIGPKYAGAEPDDPALLELVWDMASGLGAKVFAEQSLALRDRIDQCETLAQFKRPALILSGDQDQLCPLDRHEQMAQLMPQADWQVLPGIGHISTLQAPELTTAALRTWLEKIDVV
jgi:pimeloyl-ACP methyl ester carboxylesterase